MTAPPDDAAHAATAKMRAGSAAAVVAASMIGAGVYTTSGYSLGDLGLPYYVIAAWAIGGVIAICGAICYGALAQQFTESGGEYLFLARAVHPAAGMMAGWVSLLAGFAGAMAFAASTFASFLQQWNPALFGDVSQPTIGIGLVIGAAVIHSLGLQRGTGVQNAVVVIKLVMIAIFLLISFAFVSSWQGFPATEVVPPLSVGEDAGGTSGWQFTLVFANALTWISLSYSGFNAAVYLTDEIEQPKRNVPRAMVIGTIGVTVIYLLLNTVFVFAPAADEIRGQSNVATLAADAVGRQVVDRGYGWGAIIPTLVRIAILTGLATSVLALTQTGPRVYQKMAADRLMPRWLAGGAGNMTQGRGSAWGFIPAIWTQAALAIFIISVATLREQLDYLGFTLSICAALCGALVLVLRHHRTHPVRAWGHPLIPIIYVGGTLVIATLTAIRVPIQAAVGLGTLSVGILAYLLSHFLWGSRASGDRGNC